MAAEVFDDVAEEAESAVAIGPFFAGGKIEGFGADFLYEVRLGEVLAEFEAVEAGVIFYAGSVRQEMAEGDVAPGVGGVFEVFGDFVVD